jgi:hypothetical protein
MTDIRVVWLSWLRTETPAQTLETALRLMQHNGWMILSVSVVQSPGSYKVLEAFVTCRRANTPGGDTRKGSDA